MFDHWRRKIRKTEQQIPASLRTYSISPYVLSLFINYPPDPRELNSETMKKQSLTLILLLISINSSFYAQVNSPDKEIKVKILERPPASASQKVEEYVTKAIEAYDESRKL